MERKMANKCIGFMAFRSNALKMKMFIFLTVMSQILAILVFTNYTPLKLMSIDRRGSYRPGRYANSSKLSCKDRPKPSHSTYGPTGDKHWHFLSTENYTLFVNSAFYDDRISGGKIPSVEILIVGDIEETTPVYCYVWYNGTEKPYITPATFYQGFVHTIKDKTHFQYMKSRGILKEYIASCTLTSSEEKHPSHVSLRTGDCSQSDILLPVIIPEELKERIPTGVCVSISYGQIDFALLVEWMELNKIFGVGEFNVYFAYLTDAMEAFFDYYKTTGEVILHKMPAVIPIANNVTVAKPYVKLNSLPSLNHCLFTNMHRYDTIAVLDYDEVIMPTKHMTYAELVEELNKQYNYGDNWVSYTFRNVYFFQDLDPDTSQPKYLSKLQYRKKSKPTPYLKYPKSLINPRTCQLTGNHYCVKACGSTRGISTKPDVPTDVATSHHYRICPTYLNCTDYLSSVTKDDTLLKYKQQLVKTVKPILDKLHYAT